MPPAPDPAERALDLAARGFEVYARDVLAPRVYPLTERLEVEAWQPGRDRHPTIGEAEAAEYVPVARGWRWGPKWSTCWFRLSGRVPESFAGREVHLRFSCATEATLWLEGEPKRGFDVNRAADRLLREAPPGWRVRAHVEAACNHPFGVVTFDWDTADTLRRWKSPDPGELERAELAVYDADAWDLHRRYRFAVELLRSLDPSSSRARQLLAALTACTDAHKRGDADAADWLLNQTLTVPAAGSAPECYAVGHAHLDTAWLWPIRETRRKFVRTATNVLELLGRFGEFRFLCSQAQQYAWLEEDAPGVFERVRAAVEAGVWEPGGAMWIEPDANCPSGESLIRQVLHGERYWTRAFGERGRQSFVYLPDTFGFPATLPGIMRACGLDAFITNKLSWNTVTTFPHTHFVWRGLDGSEVVAHCTPGGDYNASQTPRELRRGEANHRTHPAEGPAAYLQPFGFGDGGGGPTDWSIRNTQLAADCDGLPRCRLARTDAFLDALREQAEAGGLPVWDGELYLELHRATLTTQSRLKIANRRAEHALALAEVMTFAGPESVEPEVGAKAMAHLDRAWKLTLLNQFHDILPGSSIGEVYEDARRDHDEVETLTERLIGKAMKRWAKAFDTTDADEPAMVVNPAPVERSGVVEVGTDEGPRLKFVKHAPAWGAKVIDLAASSGCVPVTVAVSGEGAERRCALSNGVIEAVLDARGRLLSVARIGGRDAVAEDTADEGLNVLALYTDRPHAWDAWDIDPGYEGSARIVGGVCERFEVVEEGPLRVRVRTERALGERSRVAQEFVLDAGSPRLDICSEVDWREEHTLLRALFPVDVRATEATYAVQFGHVRRPTHRNRETDAAMFENCAHGWVDVSEPGLGVAVLDDGKYGRSCDENTLGVTLLRAPTHPDPEADRGEHRFTYSVMPHEGDWRAAGVDAEAACLNAPLRAVVPAIDQEGAAGAEWAPVELVYPEDSGETARAQVVAIKRAEDSERLVVRLVEVHGGRGEVALRWGLDVAAVRAVDALERAIDDDRVGLDEGVTLLRLAPFEIVTLEVELA